MKKENTQSDIKMQERDAREVIESAKDNVANDSESTAVWQALSGAGSWG